MSAFTTRDVVFPETVLVVDDEEVVLMLLGEIFASRNMEVYRAETGEKGLEILKSHGIGCLLTDKNLPGMDGIELVGHARTLQPYCACIVMTAFSSTESAVEALRLGALDYLEKPFDDLDLVAEKVDKAIVSQRAQFERDELMKRIRDYGAQLQKDPEHHISELQMFERVMDARIREAVDDLRRKTKILKGRADVAEAKLGDAAGNAKALVEAVRALQIDAGERDRLMGQASKIAAALDS